MWTRDYAYSRLCEAEHDFYIAFTETFPKATARVFEVQLRLQYNFLIGFRIIIIDNSVTPATRTTIHKQGTKMEFSNLRASSKHSIRGLRCITRK